jgi:small redox-active disulfide protein 2
MIVKVLGVGCTKCKSLEQRLQDLKSQYQLDIEIQKVSEIKDIMSYGIMVTPGLVIDGKLKSVGKVPREDEILKWIEEV